MKLIYEIKNEDEFLTQLKTIADRYNTKVLEYDEEPGYFIFIKDKLKIAEKNRENAKFAYVWNATQEDLSFLNSIWGDPKQIIEPKMTPLEFATELLEIPKVENLAKEEIIKTLGITEIDLEKYSRFIKMASRKSNISEDVKKANIILERF